MPDGAGCVGCGGSHSPGVGRCAQRHRGRLVGAGHLGEVRAQSVGVGEAIAGGHPRGGSGEVQERGLGPVLEQGLVLNS